MMCPRFPLLWLVRSRFSRETAITPLSGGYSTKHPQGFYIAEGEQR